VSDSKDVRSEFWVAEDIDKIIKVSDSASVYKQIKRENKIVSRPAHSVFFDFDDDEVAPIYAFLNYNRSNERIVYAPTLALDYALLGRVPVIAYAVVSKSGIYHYSQAAMRSALKQAVQSKGGIRYLSGWKEQQEWSRNTIKEMLEDYQAGKLKL